MTRKRGTRCNTGFCNSPGHSHEAYLSTLKDTPKTYARIPRTHEDEGWTCGPECTKGQGTRTLGCLIGRNASNRSIILRKSSDFEAVLRSGLRFASRNFVLRARANALAYARLGIIAGRKSAARAVDRNRGKRLIREVFRAARPGLGLYDVTIQLRTNLRSETNDSLRAELRKLLDGLARFVSPAQPPKTGNQQ